MQYYSDTYAHFIAGGRTLHIIKQVESGKKRKSPRDDLQTAFANKLTGARTIDVNPEAVGVNHPHFRDSRDKIAATFEKIGELYVVSVPHRLRGFFNEASRAESAKQGCNMVASYRYEWFIPPDSTPIPYSKVVEMKERQMGDQTKPRSVNEMTHCYPW